MFSLPPGWQSILVEPWFRNSQLCCSDRPEVAKAILRNFAVEGRRGGAMYIKKG